MCAVDTVRAVAFSRPSRSYPEISWSGWGDPGRVPALPDALRALLTGALEVRQPSGASRSIADVALAPSRLSPDSVAELAAIVGPENARADAEARVRHTRGKSTPDLLQLRAGEADDAPDLVLMPGSHE